METRGARIRARRKALGLNQTQLAVLAGVDQSTISDLESKDAEPGAELLMKLAYALQMSAEEIMLGRDERMWPFTKIAMERYLRLDDVDRGYVQGKLEEAIEKCEGENPPPTSQQVLEQYRPVRKVITPRKEKRRA
jgi:transcriptional regulator with XRE-family HTH domain